jgi:adenylate kinase family enzyme
MACAQGLPSPAQPNRILPRVGIAGVTVPQVRMRIVVVGTSGAGKTTMARRIAAALDLPCIELDRLNWKPNWEALSESDPNEFVRSVTEAIAAKAWVSDGNYGLVQDLIWRRATHLIWLDYGRGLIMYRVIRRSIVWALDRRELWSGTSNREDWRRWLRPSHPIRWAWRTWRERRTRFEELLSRPQYGHLAVLRLRAPRDAVRVLKKFC